MPLAEWRPTETDPAYSRIAAAGCEEACSATIPATSEFLRHTKVRSRCTTRPISSPMIIVTWCAEKPSCVLAAVLVLHHRQPRHDQPLEPPALPHTRQRAANRYTLMARQL